MELLRHIYFSFPIQLLLTAFKRHQILLVFWVLLFSIIVGKFAISFGVPYLFLDPEYLDHSGYLAFSLVGVGFGFFFRAWNLNSYLLHSYRFPFMARFDKPMGVYFLNNAIIPLAFLFQYFYAIVQFQRESQYASPLKVVACLIGFSLGFTAVLLFTALYFSFTNRSALSAESERKRQMGKSPFFKPLTETDEINQHPRQRVDYYINYKLRLHSIKSLERHHPETIRLIFRQHHINAFFVELMLLVLLVCIGFFIEIPVFQIPPAASAFMFLSILLSLFGFLIYWTGGWGTTALVVFFIIANSLYQIDILGYHSRAYGLDYKQPTHYGVDSLRSISSPAHIQHDITHFYTILENWRIKNSKGKPHGYKPKMLFLNVSGGGLRAASFTTAVLQQADSLLGGRLFDKTFMISGASGGMFGAAYMRELFLQKKDGMPINLQDRQYTTNIAKDLLNPVCIAMFSNDMLLPFHQFQLDSFSYYKDRGYMLERKLSINTRYVLEKRMEDYYHDELYARIPFLVIHTEVMNDARRFFISAQPVSFLMRPVGKYTTNRNLEIDAIDFCKFFKAQHGERLTLLSALRMNATFPLILPNSELPTIPKTYILDGGALDDLGYEPTFRVLGTFRDWINENTSGAVILQIRDGAKHEDDNMIMDQQDLFTMLTNPLGTIFGNQLVTQGFIIDQKFGYANEALKGRVNMISIEYTAEKENEKATLSLHLTQREKESIIKALDRPNNVEAFKLLKEGVE